LAGYGFLRFFLQFARGDRTPVVGFLDINQIFSLIFVLIAGLLWWRFRRKRPVPGEAKPASPTADTMQPQQM
jgi:prolipoprotein diacylglyceryltransferase